MTSAEFGSFTLPLLLLIATAHFLGFLFTRIRQPRVIGEILAGVVLGPAVFGRFSPALSNAIFPVSTLGEELKYQVVIGFLYNLGLLLLMFVSGAEAKGLFVREDRKEVIWLGGIGTGLPFLLALLCAPFLPLDALAGTANQRTSLLLVIGIAVAVTSIPVISKIFHDLGILATRFARLVLTVAVIEDIILWAVLAVATALAVSGDLPERQIALHVLSAAVYFGLGLTVFPSLLRKLTRASWNVLAKSAPVTYIAIILLTFTALAVAMDVSLMFGAFLAGYALVSAEELRDATVTLGKVSFAIFIPVYFAVVGYQLDLTRKFSFVMFVMFLTLACAVKLVSVGLGSKLAGFSWLDSVNLSVALNARGGPGIILASVAYDVGIINAGFYTTLVLTAILTSMVAGAWLDYVLRRGWPLLGEQPVEQTVYARSTN